jgi:hypothetical protein
MSTQTTVSTVPERSLQSSRGLVPLTRLTEPLPSHHNPPPSMPSSQQVRGEQLLDGRAISALEYPKLPTRLPASLRGKQAPAAHKDWRHGWYCVNRPRILWKTRQGRHCAPVWPIWTACAYTCSGLPGSRGVASVTKPVSRGPEPAPSPTRVSRLNTSFWTR